MANGREHESLKFGINYKSFPDQRKIVQFNDVYRAWNTYITLHD